MIQIIVISAIEKYRFRVSNANLFLKTLYQIKAFNLFFIIELTSWKYLFTFKSYTYKHTENTCPGFPPLKNTVLPRFRVSNVNIFKKTLYIKLKPLISSLLWNLHHEHISFRSKVIPINVLKNTCPGFKPSCDRRSQNITTGLFGLLHDLLTFIVQLHDVISWRKREYVCLITNKKSFNTFLPYRI